ncbi:MAG TPA: hypothetical protein VNW95_14465 [Mucilaginibacter sp.]|jgi:hypothetical protein|nr:hypothetical protein [Mucilaginibacter sp.]
MKYAFVIGSNAFVVPRNRINYGETEHENEFLRINAIYHDLPNAETSFLDIDLDIKDRNGAQVTVLANILKTGGPYILKKERDSVWVLKPDGSVLVQVHQLDDESAMALEHNIAAELEVNTPVVVIRLTGEFMAGDLHIRAENEKLFINDNGYANSVLAGANELRFSSEGVVL